jgi:hypothetical protein
MVKIKEQQRRNNENERIVEKSGKVIAIKKSMW